MWELKGQTQNVCYTHTGQVSVTDLAQAQEKRVKFLIQAISYKQNVIRLQKKQLTLLVFNIYSLVFHLSWCLFNCFQFLTAFMSHLALFHQ